MQARLIRQRILALLALSTAPLGCGGEATGGDATGGEGAEGAGASGGRATGGDAGGGTTSGGAGTTAAAGRGGSSTGGHGGENVASGGGPDGIGGAASGGQGNGAGAGGSPSTGGSAGIAGSGGSPSTGGSAGAPSLCPEGIECENRCFSLSELEEMTFQELDSCPPAAVGPLWSSTTTPDLPPGSCIWLHAGPALSDDGNCCYGTSTTEFCGGGRPLTVQGVPQRARPERRADWLSSVAPEVAPAGSLAACLAEAWLNDARLEHASVASFARLALHLMAVGAPPALVARAQQASLDEITHARDCFALASRYLGEAVGPGALEIRGALTDTSLEALVVDTINEGCVMETFAAIVATEQSKHCTDPDTLRILARIADDEARHAELGWAIVAWALNEQPELCATAERAFEQAQQKLERASSAASDVADSRAWEVAGRLSNATTRKLAATTRDEIVAPCSQALLAAVPPQARA